MCAQVRSLAWAPDDAHLISAGMDGAVYEWRLKDFKREKENVLKGVNYTSVLATPDCRQLYAVRVAAAVISHTQPVWL